jgi:hypothetical protein
MTSANRRGVALPILCLAFAACSKQDVRAKAATDPNAPAVVKLPPPILPSDTAKKPVIPVVTAQDAAMALSQRYALLGAGFAFADPQLVREAYAPAAQLTTPNGTFTGQTSIVKELSSLGTSGSVKDFQRTSRVMKVVDSTVVDSGTFTIVRRRPGADSVVEHGFYSSEWRIHPPPALWTMTRDHLYETARKKVK